jgi:DNA-binding response OmpR family regulator
MEQPTMPHHMTLVLADNIETGKLRANILKMRGIASSVVRYGPKTTDLKLPKHFDLVVVDSHYTAESAMEVVQHIRERSTAPLMLLTYETDERNHLDAYRQGVDECVTKPISELLFLAKVTAWLRQAAHVDSDSDGAPPPSSHTNHEKISHNGFTLDSANRRVCTQDGRSVKLSTLEFRLLHLFLANHGRVLETNQLLKKVWNYEDVDSRLLTNLVYRLRQKLSTTSIRSDHIRTLEQVGYIFE